MGDKNYNNYMKPKDEIIEALAKASGLKPEEIHLEKPELMEHGDYASNIAMAIFSKLQNPKFKTQKSVKYPISDIKSPRQLAERIVKQLKSDKNLSEMADRIEVAGPGFINFWLSKVVLFKELGKVVKEGEVYGKSDILKGRRYLLEHTSPNTIKTLHVGHVRNNVLGMAVHNLLEYNGAEVKLDAINNDRGIHVMKAVWAYIKFGEGKTPKDDGLKPDHFVDKFYVMGAKAYDEDGNVKKEMHRLLIKWEEGDKVVRNVWKKLRDWTFAGFKETYLRLGSYHDHQWFESDFYQHGKEMVEEGLKKGVFRKLPDGAILSNLEKYGLTDTIVLRADGTSMYHTQDLYLTKLKREKFPSDLYIWDIGPEQDLYLKQLFAMCEQLGIGARDDYFHLSYGYVFLKGGRKMSSRAGNIISADDLIKSVVDKAQTIVKNSETNRGLEEFEVKRTTEAVGLAAIKYAFLKVARDTDLYFDIDESLALEGNSGPYLQYTYARTQSVLAKSKRVKDWKSLSKMENGKWKMENEELALLRTFVQFQGVLVNAGKNYSPSLLCNYLYDLAHKFNGFYNSYRILEPESGSKEPITNHQSLITRDFRVALTFATGQILKNGLEILGIQAPERM